MYRRTSFQMLGTELKKKTSVEFDTRYVRDYRDKNKDARERVKSRIQKYSNTRR